MDSPGRQRPPPATAIALVAGMLGAVQPKVNAALATRLDSAVLASLVNFAVALLAGSLVVLVARPSTRRHLRAVVRWPVPRWTFLAGFGGVLVVLAGALTVDTIGVAIFSVAFYAGQLTAGLAVDRLRIGAGGVRPLEAVRLQAAGLALVAVFVSQLGRPVGDFEPGLVLFVLAAGAASAFQAAANGRIAAALDDPAAPTAVNTTVGTVALLAVVGVLAASGRVDAPVWPTDEPWLFAGGLLGVVIVLSMAIGAAALGVLRATLAMLAAQLCAAIAVDWIVSDEPPTAGVLTGALLIIGAVVLLARDGWRTTSTT